MPLILPAVLAFCFVLLTILFFKVVFRALYVVSRIPTRLQEWWGSSYPAVPLFHMG